jgi:type II secretion system protein L
MARLIVALDIAARTVRFVALAVNGKDVVFDRFGEEPILTEEGPQPAVQRLLSKLDTPIDAVVGIFYLQNASVRNLRLPFSDRKRIDQILPFELEGVFPFDAEDAVFNYFPVSKPTKEKPETELLVGAARKELVSSRIETYRATGHEPKNLLVDAFALEAAWLASENAPLDQTAEGESANGDTTALLFLGPDETLLLIVRTDGYRLARSFRIGRRELVARAAKSLGKDAAEIEAAMASGEGRETAEAILRPLMRDVEATLRSSEKTARERPSKLVVGGEMAMWPGVVDAAGLALKIPGEELRWSEAARGSSPTGSLGDFAPLVGAALQSLRGGGLDLRAGEFVYTRAIQLVKGKLFVTGGFAAALLLLLLFSNVFTYFTKSSQSNKLKAEMEQIFSEAMPGEPIVDPVQQIDAQVRTLREQIEGGGGETVVDTLKAISQAVSPTMKFTINEYHKDASGVRIKAETDSYENIDTIKNAIAALPGMKGITVSDSKTTATGGIVFELTVEGAAR